MADQWTDRLSEYVDGELSPGDRRRLDEHLKDCGECREGVSELERVVARARALEDRGPTTDLWPAIARRIGATSATAAARTAARRPRFRFTFSLVQLAAAAVALITVSAGTMWFVGRRASGMQMAATTPAAVEATGVVPAAVVARTYDVAVRDLERVLDEGRGQLDSVTVRVLEQNLRLIDSALVECRRAVAADPASAYLNAHLADTMKRKLDLLRQAARLASRT